VREAGESARGGGWNPTHRRFRAELAVAVDTTRRLGFFGSHSLCHGALGNLDVLLRAADATGDDALRDEVFRRAAGTLAGIAQSGWLCGVPLAVETPGLLVGLAGIGYGLLCLAHPSRVPSVLSFELPEATS
jgi:lantibiotic modifying enzyme